MAWSYRPPAEMSAAGGAQRDGNAESAADFAKAATFALAQALDPHLGPDASVIKRAERAFADRAPRRWHRQYLL
jgi:hypothetical protein